MILIAKKTYLLALGWWATAMMFATPAMGHFDDAVSYQCTGDCSGPDGALDCYTLTKAENSQVGAVWSQNKVDISSSFQLEALVFLGYKDRSGADGIAFVIQQIGNEANGGGGGGIGYLGLAEYFAVEIDTWYNHGTNDILSDHISVSSKKWVSGAEQVTVFGNSVSAISNVEDGEFHKFRVTWDARDGALKVYLDDKLVLTTTVPSISAQLTDTPSTAYFGFTSATGGRNNLQKVCSISQSSPTPPPTPAVCVCPTSPPSLAPVRAPTMSPSSAPSFESVSHAVCENFAVHAQTTVTFAGVTSTINGGDVGVSPGTSITGAFTFTGGAVVADSAEFAARVLLAHAEAMAIRPDEDPLAIEIGGLTFTPGTYRSGSAINFAYGTVVTLDGENESNPVFLFQAGSTLVTAANTYFILKNGAKAENVYWALGTAATLGANSVLEGSILAGTAITFGTQSELHGCALALSAVTFESEGSIELNHYFDEDGSLDFFTRQLRGRG